MTGHLSNSIWERYAAKHIIALVIAAAGVLTSSTSLAIDYKEELSQRVKVASNPAALGVDLFGDSVDWYFGGVQFRVVDVDLPGNNSLPVRVARSTSTAPREGGPLIFANWNIEVPFISGIFAAVSPWRTDRCTGPQTAAQVAPPPAQSNPIPTPAGAGEYTTFAAHEYWRGYTIVIPGYPDGQLLWRDPTYTAAPTDGGNYRWVTNTHIQISCLATLASGQIGEGFLAVTPDGTRYYFNWLVTKPYNLVSKPIIGQPNLEGSDYALDRVYTRIYATKIEDRFGNSVNLTYVDDRPTKIQSNDGRQISIYYNSTKVDHITAGGVASSPGYDGKQATWTYGYSAAGKLSTVTLPDGSAWKYSDPPILYITYKSDPYGESETCELPAEYLISSSVPKSSTWTMTHPSGAIGTFKFEPRLHYRSNTGTYCGYLSSHYTGATIPVGVRQFSLVEKTISGPSLSNQKWSIDYLSTRSAPTEIVTVTNPDLSSTKYTLGTQYFRDEGKLLSKQTYEVGGALLETETYSYAIDPISAPYSYRVGYSGMEKFNQGSVPCCDNFNFTMQVPVTSKTIIRNGVTYSRSTAVSDFDLFSKPNRVVRSNTSGATKTDLIAYSQNYNKWVIGQITSTTDEATGLVEANTIYNATTALPEREYKFGHLENKYTYYADGTPHTVEDVLARTTTLSNWKRGLPQNIQFADSSSMTSIINDLGWVASETDQRGSTTGYGYDAVGRLSSVTYPTETSTTWENPVPIWQNPTIVYSKLTSSELNLPIGTWRKQETLGRHRTRTYYDARWQPILEEDLDTQTNKYIYRRHRYDHNGLAVFDSYPSETSTASAGISSNFDALQRLLSRQTVDGVALETSEYLSGGQKRITDADGRKVTISYQAFDSPAYKLPTRIEGEETQLTTIGRDLFGKINAVTQSGTWNGSAVSQTRAFTYDSYQRPCRRVDPESGSTVWGYDDASQVLWELKGASGTGCVTAQPAGATTFAYDPLGRKILDDHPGTADDVTYGYADHINLTSVSNAASTWSYFYNKRNLIEGEQAVVDGRTFSLDPTYDSLANLQSLKTPTKVISYEPDAWGRPTQLGSYASNIQYHPNGLIQGYGLGNGISYTQTLDARMRPYQQITAHGSDIVQQYQYGYSLAGDLISLADQTDGDDYGPNRLTLVYDNLHRLKTATGLWGTYGYAYDPLNNLRARTGGVTRTYNYSASTNRLTTVTQPSIGGTCVDCCPPSVQACQDPPPASLMAVSAMVVGGAVTPPTTTTLRSFSYNTKGEITGDSLRTFTLSNQGQISGITGIASYTYDGNGKRIKSVKGGNAEYALYDLAGRLVYTEQGATKTDYLRLGGVNIVEIKRSGTADIVQYLHPDLLGSPRKATDASANILWNEHFDPYGLKLNGVSEKIGFTGHAFDVESGFTYMQARFFDPFIGRFMSTDSVYFKDEDPFTFNRYSYTDNNPYKYKDPSGNDPIPTSVANIQMADMRLYTRTDSLKPIFEVQRALQMQINFSYENRQQTLNTIAATTGIAAMTPSPVAPELALTSASASGLSIFDKAITTGHIGLDDVFLTLLPLVPGSWGALAKGLDAPELVQPLNQAQGVLGAVPSATSAINGALVSGQRQGPAAVLPIGSDFQGVFNVGGRIEAMKLEEQLNSEKR